VPRSLAVLRSLAGAIPRNIEYALDAGQEDLALAPSEGRVILDALEDCPDDLVPLRDELRRTHGATG